MDAHNDTPVVGMHTDEKKSRRLLAVDPSAADCKRVVLNLPEHFTPEWENASTALELIRVEIIRQVDKYFIVED